MKRSEAPWQLASLVAILLLALLLRLAPWGYNRFLEDEALYAYWGLQIATGADPMLNEEPVDKPPLYPYTLALSFLLTTPDLPGEAPIGAGHESAARLPSILASMASIALVYALASRLWFDPYAGLIAALLLALSPFDILFASTAFTDPLMVALMLGALAAAAGMRPGLAGLLAGLSAATKQQGLFFLPLIVVIAWPALPPKVPGGDLLQSHRVPGWLRKAWRQGWLRFALGFGLVIAGVLWWDLARVQRPGFLEQGFISYGGLGPAQPASLGQRGADWLRLVGSFWVSPWFNLLLIAAFLRWLAGGLLSLWRRWGRIELRLGLFCIAYLLVHWLVGFQVWDRYLLGLVPLLALLGARVLTVQRRATPHSDTPTYLRASVLAWARHRRYVCVLAVVLIAILAAPALSAARSELPMGGDHGAYDGIDQLATYLRDQAPPGSVLYHYWLGYHYRFYLYDAPLRLHWYPDLGDLGRDAQIYRREPRYIAFPSWRDSEPAVSGLREAGIATNLVYETTRRDGTGSFRLYRMEGP